MNFSIRFLLGFPLWRNSNHVIDKICVYREQKTFNALLTL